MVQDKSVEKPKQKLALGLQLLRLGLAFALISNLVAFVTEILGVGELGMAQGPAILFVMLAMLLYGGLIALVVSSFRALGSFADNAIRSVEILLLTTVVINLLVFLGDVLATALAIIPAVVWIIYLEKRGKVLEQFPPGQRKINSLEKIAAAVSIIGMVGIIALGALFLPPEVYDGTGGLVTPENYSSCVADEDKEFCLNALYESCVYGIEDESYCAMFESCVDSSDDAMGCWAEFFQ